MKPSIRPGDRSRGALWLRSGVVAALAAGCVAAPAYAQTVQATGTGQAEVHVTKPLSQLKIARAVETARDLAVPRAFLNTRVQATRYATAAQLVLGDIVAVEEPVASPLGGYFFGTSFGRFGPNKYCGRVTTVKRRTVDGVRKVVSRKTRVRCFKPEYISVSVAVTFNAAPVPATTP
jgi:hypothetical protein